jgi:deoxyribose-phosphate aldolase
MTTQQLPTVAAVAGMIDHAILKPELTRADVDEALDTAAAHHVFSVCVRPSDVAHAVARLEGTGVHVGTVIGFPHGTTSTEAKVAESRQAVADGAVELDMVVNVGRLRSGLLDDVEADVRAVVEAAATTRSSPGRRPRSERAPRSSRRRPASRAAAPPCPTSASCATP